MNGALKGKGEALLVTDDKGNPLGVATPMVHGETFHVGPSQHPEQHSPSGDMEKYFHSVKQLRKPTPGLYQEYLDHVMENTQSEKPGSSNTASANLYWATMWAKDIWDEFNQLNQDYDKMFNDIQRSRLLKRIPYESDDYWEKVENQLEKKKILIKSAKDLKLVLNSLNDCIEVSLKEWAWRNDLDQAFFTREFASGKK
ncbi:uncharacterized protein PGTG_19391 [Puccinia graminis f. sp. tritici CRL 75-36-700-3]|uniref:Uncharacterized protein n=2 Tax=Puccinia graminis f. sp. tritici TaxID=56615 RepID=E3LAA4_PUCGT|nr:uncharacterized protein PGTG_19391 [Puccinia graminis f. sp. tritici CRL 75-36-700-3]EFP93479.2 hypothetical protein PGTG_19391 [Puccinia graminis f. sp. tritici CRL 75-36-700-3]